MWICSYFLAYQTSLQLGFVIANIYEHQLSFSYKLLRCFLSVTDTKIRYESLNTLKTLCFFVIDPISSTVCSILAKHKNLYSPPPWKQIFSGQLLPPIMPTLPSPATHYTENKLPASFLPSPSTPLPPRVH